MQKLTGNVIATFSAKKGQSGLPRPQVNELELICGFGIKNDKFAGQDDEKAVMIVGQIAYNIAKEQGINLELGSLGENVLLDINPHDYPVGTIFQIGNTVIQTTQNCTICNHLAVFGKDLPVLVKDCRGVYCKILSGGEITHNQEVKVLKSWKSSSGIAS